MPTARPWGFPLAPKAGSREGLAGWNVGLSEARTRIANRPVRRRWQKLAVTTAQVLVVALGLVVAATAANGLDPVEN